MDLQPIIPFEPRTSDTIPIGPEWLAQVKWDGVRVLTYYDGNEVKLYNRKRHERTFHYPELVPVKTYCKAESVILDGEVIAIGEDGKPSFREVMKRDGIRRMERIPFVTRAVPIVYMIFDLVYCNREWVRDQPLWQRAQMLSHLILPGEHIQLVGSHEDGQALFSAITERDMEGILAKRRNSIYEIGGKNDDWLKIKNYRDLIAVAGGVTFRGNVVNSVLFGLYDTNGNLHYIGHAGTGRLSQSDWQELTEQANAIANDECPFSNLPERAKGTMWLKPQLTAKLRYTEWTEGHSLRQPSIQAFVQVRPEECVFRRDMMR